MQRGPFQFGLASLLITTLVVAVVAWLVRDQEWPVQLFAMPYLVVGVGQMAAALAVFRRLMDANALDDHDHRGACEWALMNFFLTLPCWILMLDAVSLQVATSVAGFALLCLMMALHIGAVFFNLASWMVYFRPLRDWRLDVLRLLNLANSTILFSAVFLEWRR